MSKLKIIIVGAALIIFAASIGIYVVFSRAVPSKVQAVAATSSETTVGDLYLDQVPKECADTDVSDEYVCIYNYASGTLSASDKLAAKLITGAPIRLHAIASTPNAADMAMKWEYGGADFLSDLPAAVRSAQKSRDAYIQSICRLEAMVIYGGSGQDLEVEACRYHYAQQYLDTLRRLEGGLAAHAQ